MYNNLVCVFVIIIIKYYFKYYYAIFIKWVLNQGSCFFTFWILVEVCIVYVWA